jgi:hypothetical protein
MSAALVSIGMPRRTTNAIGKTASTTVSRLKARRSSTF